jgi:exodeoxyribonuclease VII small subunit
MLRAMAARKKSASASPPASEQGPSFEERLAALEAVVRDLEGEELPLEESLERYRTGVEHLRACRSLLDDAEARLVELAVDAGGQIRETPLVVGDEGLRPEVGGPDTRSRSTDRS